MRRSVYSITALLVLAAASGCTLPTGLLKAGGGTVQTAGKPAATATLLTGSVMAPAGIISAGGGNVISAGGANLKVLALTENALANTEVYLADAAGEPLPGVEPVKTDAKGQYKFENVPEGYTFVVAARCKTADGKDATLQTMTRPAKLGATANINASTTLVTAAVVDGQSDLGEFNAAKFKTAAEATAKSLKPDALPDFADRSKILAAVAEMQKTIAELKAAIEEIRADLKDIKASLEDLKKQLADRKPGGMMPPPPGGIQPPMQPPTGMNPPPDGRMQPPPGDQGQPPAVAEHQFSVSDVPDEHFPLLVRVVVPNGGQVWAEFKFASATDRPVGRLPEGPGHNLEFVSPKGKAMIPNFAVPVGAPREIKLPTPRFDGSIPGTDPGTTTGTTPGTDPNAGTNTGTTTPRQPFSRKLSMKLDSRAPFFQKATYPLVVEFFAGDGRSLKQFSFTSATEVSVQDMPCGVKGKLTYTPVGNRPASLDFGFPESGPDEFILPGPAAL